MWQFWAAHMIRRLHYPHIHIVVIPWVAWRSGRKTEFIGPNGSVFVVLEGEGIVKISTQTASEALEQGVGTGRDTIFRVTMRADTRMFSTCGDSGCRPGEKAIDGAGHGDVRFYTNKNCRGPNINVCVYCLSIFWYFETNKTRYSVWLHLISESSLCLVARRVQWCILDVSELSTQSMRTVSALRRRGYATCACYQATSQKEAEAELRWLAAAQKQRPVSS